MKDVVPNFDTYDPYDAKYFISVGAHKKERYYPRHDLEAFAYMIHFLFHECLPHAGSNRDEPITLDAIKVGKDRTFTDVIVISIDRILRDFFYFFICLQATIEGQLVTYCKEIDYFHKIDYG